MKKLLVIYGPPRTGTTFMLSGVLSHEHIHGSMKDCDENPKINIMDIGNQREIDRLHSKYVHDDNWLVIKAPGYSFGYEYFSKLNDYCVKYIQTNRYYLEVILSMLNHPISFKCLKMDLESTDCPQWMRPHYKQRWEDAQSSYSGRVKRAQLRYEWHISCVDRRQVKESLCFSVYHDRINGMEVTRRICKYLGLPFSTNMSLEMNNFHHRPLKIDEITKMLVALHG